MFVDSTAAVLFSVSVLQGATSNLRPFCRLHFLDAIKVFEDIFTMIFLFRIDSTFGCLLPSFLISFWCLFLAILQM